MNHDASLGANSSSFLQHCTGDLNLLHSELTVAPLDQSNAPSSLHESQLQQPLLAEKVQQQQHVGQIDQSSMWLNHLQTESASSRSNLSSVLNGPSQQFPESAVASFDPTPLSSVGQQQFQQLSQQQQLHPSAVIPGSQMGQMMNLQAYRQPQQQQLFSQQQQQQGMIQLAMTQGNPSQFFQATSVMQPQHQRQYKEDIETTSSSNRKNSNKRRAKSFPEKLISILIETPNAEAVNWLPDGKSFVILNPETFIDEVLNKVFKEVKYASFIRKLHRWGFVRLTSGAGTDCFHHPLFTRSDPSLAAKICCTTTPQSSEAKKKTAKASHTESFRHAQEYSNSLACMNKPMMVNGNGSGSSSNDPLASANMIQQMQPSMSHLPLIPHPTPLPEGDKYGLDVAHLLKQPTGPTTEDLKRTVEASPLDLGSHQQTRLYSGSTSHGNHDQVSV